MTMDEEPVAPGDLLTARVPQVLADKRLDQALATLFPEYSRARLQEWVRGGQVLIDNRSWRPRDKVRGGEWIEIAAPVVADGIRQEAQEIALQIVYEDAALLVIDKPVGLVVHPGAGNHDRTLLNALLYRAPELANVPRAGIVHRLDKNTSGLLVVARTLSAHKSLVEQLSARTVQREYDAVVVGVMSGGGRIDLPLARHAVERTRMAVTHPGRGKPAVTHYRVAHRFRGHSHVKLRLETGRTHQIRVHLAHLHYPIVGDPQYGGRPRLSAHAGEGLIDALRGFKRQALHAGKLGLIHPVSGEAMQWTSPLPEDMAKLLALLRADAEVNDL